MLLDAVLFFSPILVGTAFLVVHWWVGRLLRIEKEQADRHATARSRAPSTR